MGIRRYITPGNWYSTSVKILLIREPNYMEKIDLKNGHAVKKVTYDNVTDTQRFEKKSYIKIYQNMLQHGDSGYFGYIDGKCACRLWGMVRPKEQLYYGSQLDMKEDGIYVHYVETAKDFRRQGIARECLASLIDDYQDRYIYSIVNIENLASMNLHKELGFKEKTVLMVKKRRLRESTEVYWLDCDK